MHLAVGLKNYFVVFALTIFIVTNASAELIDSSRLKSCEAFLDGKKAEKTQFEQRLNQRFELWDLLSEDGLALKHPSIVMNAPQRILAMIREGGKSEIKPSTGAAGKINYYPFFSEGSELTHGRKIVGHEIVIDRFVEYVKRAALGDSNVIFLRGPHGTGKSEFINVISEGVANLTLNNPDHYYFTFEWIGLEKIPQLVQFFDMVTDNKGNQFIDPQPSQMNSSPFVLLPQAFQDRLIELTRDRVIELTGTNPKPFRNGSPADEYFKQEIWKHYESEKGSELTADEMLAVIAKHTRVVPKVLGGSGALPILDAQGKDVDYKSLFVSTNPVVAMTKGYSHPLSYHYNGKILSGNGVATMLDEFPRNQKELRDVFLGTFESRRIALGGAPAIAFDTLFIAAGNDESVDRMVAGEDSGAQLNRLQETTMNWSTNPYDSLETLTYMQRNGMLEAKELGLKPNEEGDVSTPFWEDVNGKLVLKDRVNNLFTGPDGRLALRINNGGSKVYISPHTLLFMTAFATVTRSSFSAKDAQSVSPDSVVNSAYFRGPVERVKYWLGETNITSTEEGELRRLMEALKEGTWGLSTRDLNRWFSAVVDQARRESNGGDAVITPLVAKKTLQSMLRANDIRVSNKVLLSWTKLADSLSYRLIVPRLKSDVTQALGREQGQSDSTYNQVIEEIIAIAKDPGAKSFEDPLTKENTPIDFKRLDSIKKYFLEQNERFDASQIGLLHASTTETASGRKNKTLMAAINQYYADLTTRSVSISSLLSHAREGQGTSEVSSIYSGFLSHMENELGYHEKAAIAALQMIQISESQKEQVMNGQN